MCTVRPHSLVSYAPSYHRISCTKYQLNQGVLWLLSRTKGITISHFRPPAPYQIDVILWDARDLRIPTANQIHILVHLVRLHAVKHNTVHILAPSQYLTEALLDLPIHLLPLMRAVDQAAQLAFPLCALLLGGGLARLSCIMR